MLAAESGIEKEEKEEREGEEKGEGERGKERRERGGDTWARLVLG